MIKKNTLKHCKSEPYLLERYFQMIFLNDPIWKVELINTVKRKNVLPFLSSGWLVLRVGTSVRKGAGPAGEQQRRYCQILGSRRASGGRQPGEMGGQHQDPEDKTWRRAGTAPTRPPAGVKGPEAAGRRSRTSDEDRLFLFKTCRWCGFCFFTGSFVSVPSVLVYR